MFVVSISNVKVVRSTYIFYTPFGLQNLCIAAAYRPVQELLEEERKVLLFS